MQKLWVIVPYVAYFFSTTHSSRALWLPKCTAIALITSSLSMLKVCVDLNLLRIHMKDSNIRKLAGLAFIYLPFFITNAMFRLSAISILITYINYLAILPVVFVIGMNILYAKKKFTNEL